MDRTGIPMKASTASTTKILSREIRCIELSVTIVWSEVGGARVSSCVDEVVIRVGAEWCGTTTSTTHFRSGKVGVVVGSVTSLSEVILAIVCARVSLGVEVIFRDDVFAGFRGGRNGLSTTARTAHGGGGEGGCVVV